MDNQKKQKAILYIEANKITFYPGQGGALAQVAIPSELVSDLEILNSQKFIEFIEMFFTSQKLASSDILVVFSETATFGKEFPETEKKETIQQFLDYVPFDSILSKTFTDNKKIYAVAVNAQYYTLLKEACEKAGSTIAGVVAYPMLKGILPALAQKVDLQLMITHFDNCRQLSMTFTTSEKTSEEVSPSQKPKDNKIYLLLGVFGVLLIVLFVMIFMTMNPAKPQQQLPAQTLPIATPTPIVSPTSTLSATPSATVTEKPLQAEPSKTTGKSQG